MLEGSPQFIGFATLCKSIRASTAESAYVCPSGGRSPFFSRLSYVVSGVSGQIGTSFEAIQSVIHGRQRITIPTNRPSRPSHSGV